MGEPSGPDLSTQSQTQCHWVVTGRYQKGQEQGKLIIFGLEFFEGNQSRWVRPGYRKVETMISSYLLVQGRGFPVPASFLLMIWVRYILCLQDDECGKWWEFFSGFCVEKLITIHWKGPYAVGSENRVAWDFSILKHFLWLHFFIFIFNGCQQQRQEKSSSELMRTPTSKALNRQLKQVKEV